MGQPGGGTLYAIGMAGHTGGGAGSLPPSNLTYREGKRLPVDPLRVSHDRATGAVPLPRGHTFSHLAGPCVLSPGPCSGRARAEPFRGLPARWRARPVPTPPQDLRDPPRGPHGRVLGPHGRGLGDVRRDCLPVSCHEHLRGARRGGPGDTRRPARRTRGRAHPRRTRPAARPSRVTRPARPFAAARPARDGPGGRAAPPTSGPGAGPSGFRSSVGFRAPGGS